MVSSDHLSPDEITEAMYHGDFYATSGVMLSKLDSNQSRISLTIDEDATANELQSTYIIGHSVEEAEPGYLIQFIGDGGKVVEQTRSTKAAFSVTSDNSYIRAKVTYTRKRGDGFENFYAWTQPVFTDGRKHFEH